MNRTVFVLLAGASISLLAAVGPAQAAFPGSNGKIAYTFGGIASPNAQQDFDIYSVNPDGTERANLTRNQKIDDFDAAWSPDGEKIAYYADARGRDEPDLFVMNADGSGKTRLTETPQVEETQPAWSPDGSRIAFARLERYDDSTGAEYDIHVINADGTGEVRLTDDPGRDDHPAWSPDGSRIAFYSTRDDGADIFTMEASPEGPSNEPARLTNGRGVDYQPDWSPDGTKIAFISNRDRLGQDHYPEPEIYVMNADGTKETRLSKRGGYRHPDWSPNGKRLAFTRDGLYTIRAAPLNDENRPRQIVTGKYANHYVPDWQTTP